MGITVKLKSNERYEFHRIRKVIIDNEFITLEGNFKKGSRYKTIPIRFETIKNIRQLLRTIRKDFHKHEYEGVCPKCDSENVYLRYEIIQEENINTGETKVRDKTPLIHKCYTCGKEFLNSKGTQKVVYYK